MLHKNNCKLNYTFTATDAIEQVWCTSIFSWRELQTLPGQTVNRSWAPRYLYFLTLHSAFDRSTEKKWHISFWTDEDNCIRLRATPLCFRLATPGGGTDADGEVEMAGSLHTAGGSSLICHGNHPIWSRHNEPQVLIKVFPVASSWPPKVSQ